MSRTLLEKEHFWIRLRLVGWVLTALMPVSDLLGQLGVPVPITRLVLTSLSLVGLVIVAVGFERVVETAHHRTGAH
ncbi:MAG TPA: hypothetical protein VFH78_13375 [Candidatus Thermoplasmatota archaeon]|nr:hypothetical protein [Candidatus Thermoplasmatota archaeon]